MRQWECGGVSLHSHSFSPLPGGPPPPPGLLCRTSESAHASGPEGRTLHAAIYDLLARHK